jgi:hypothetical protein
MRKDSDSQLKRPRRERGIFQRHTPGCARSADAAYECPWWVCYFDESGRQHREAGGEGPRP